MSVLGVTRKSSVRRGLSACAYALILIPFACAEGAADEIDFASNDTTAAVDGGGGGPVLPPGPSLPHQENSDGGCSAPSLFCGAACVDTTKDFDHCGACGNACVVGQECIDGVCGAACSGTAMRCGGKCVDTQTSMNHCGGCDVACPAPSLCTSGTCTATLTLRGYIDGQTLAVLQGGVLKWHNVRDAAPGRHDGFNYETIVNGSVWYPSWPSEGENRSCNCDSSAFTIVPPLAARATTASVLQTGGRGSIVVVEQPSAANGFALKVSYDDPVGGAMWHEAKITYATK